MEDIIFFFIFYIFRSRGASQLYVTYGVTQWVDYLS